MRRAAGRWIVTIFVLCTACVLGVSAAAAQAPLTLEDAMKRAQGMTVEARALASSIDEAEARVQQAQSGFWPRVDFTETVQRGNDPVFAFSSLLSQRRFTAANFAIPSLNHPEPITNTRTAIAIEQPVFDAGLTALGMKAIYVNANFLWFTAFVGVNLFQSAFTNWCPMMVILRKTGLRDASHTGAALTAAR